MEKSMDKISQISQKSLSSIFFIVYDDRSGSTFLANQLVKMAGVAMPPESNFIAMIFNKYSKDTVDNQADLTKILEIVYSDNKFNDWNISAADIIRECEIRLPITVGEFILLICTLYRNRNFPGAVQIGIKKGSISAHYKEIKKTFPDAKIIALIRDGRGIFNSKKVSLYSVTGKPMETDPVRAAKRWCEMTALFRIIEKDYPKDTLTIKYEELLSEFNKTFGTICKFLMINDMPKAAEYEYVIPKRYNELHKNINKEPLQERIDAWQGILSPKEILAYESIAHKLLKIEGYEPKNNQVTIKMYLLMKRIINKIRRVRARLSTDFNNKVTR